MHTETLIPLSFIITNRTGTLLYVHGIEEQNKVITSLIKAVESVYHNVFDNNISTLALNTTSIVRKQTEFFNFYLVYHGSEEKADEVIRQLILALSELDLVAEIRELKVSDEPTKIDELVMALIS